MRKEAKKNGVIGRHLLSLYSLEVINWSLIKSREMRQRTEVLGTPAMSPEFAAACLTLILPFNNCVFCTVRSGYICKRSSRNRKKDLTP